MNRTYRTPDQAANDKLLRLVDAANEYWHLWSVTDRNLVVSDFFYGRYVKAKDMLDRRGFNLVTVDSDDGLVFVAVDKVVWNSDAPLPLDLGDRVVTLEDLPVDVDQMRRDSWGNLQKMLDKELANQKFPRRADFLAEYSWETVGEDES